MNWISLAIQAIIAVQSAFPLLKGQSKKNIAIGLVQIGAGIAANAGNTHAAQIGNTIDQVIPILKAEGIFGKDQVPVPPPVTTQLNLSA